MSRPIKKGLDYFPLDVDIFSDKKIRILKARYGADGVLLYMYLLCEIYRNGYYLELDDDYEFIIAQELNMSIDKVKQVRMFLLERSMFDKQLFQSDAILTSAGIQRRFQEAVKTRALKNPIEIDEKFWLLKEEETQSFIKVNSFLNNSENNYDNSENNYDNSMEKVHKGKERKVKESNIYIPEFFDDKNLNNVFCKYLEMIEPVIQKDIDSLINKLNALSSDVETKVKIVEQSINRGWRSFYPLKNRLKNSEATKKKNTFNNGFEKHNEANFDELEKMLAKNRMK